jgi:hypothetical protein
VRVIVISLLIGGGSGVLATALTTSYLSQYAFELSKLTEPLQLTQTQPRAVPQGYEDALETIKTEALDAVGSVFAVNVPAAGFTREDRQGPAVALTSDGWMLSTEGSVGSLVRMGDRSCDVDTVRPHVLTGLSFIHCALENVSVANFGEGYEVALGDQVFVASGFDELVFTQIEAVEWKGESVRSSDVPSRRLLLGREVEPGSPVFNIAGALVGIVDPEDGTRVIPFEHFTVAFEQVLQGSDVLASAVLGVSSIDLTRTVGLDETLARGYKHGALLYGSQAVARGSSAQVAGLLVGDIVLAVDGVSIGEARTLDDLVATFSPADGERDVVTLTIDRDGAVSDIVVTLGSSVD